jgi:hypothetical protein
MDTQTPQPNPSIVPPKHSWFVRHLAAELVALALVAATIGLIYYVQTPNSVPETVTPIHREKVDVTKDWNPFTDTQYGYSFKYPSDWNGSTPKDWSEGIDFVMNFQQKGDEIGDGSITFTVEASLTPAEEMNEYKNNNLKVTKNTTILINGIKWELVNLEEKNTNLKFYVASTINQNYAFKFSSKDYPTSVSVIDQIISTFNFIDPPSVVDTATLKTYSNPQYGLEFIYPIGFSLEVDEDDSIFLSYKVYAKNNNSQIGALEIEKIGSTPYQLKDYCSHNKQMDFCITEPIPDTDAPYASSTKEVSLNGYNAIYITMKGIGEESVYLVKSPKGEAWSLRIYDTTFGADPKSSEEFQEKLNQILSTFKFTK